MMSWGGGREGVASSRLDVGREVGERLLFLETGFFSRWSRPVLLRERRKIKYLGMFHVPPLTKNMLL